MARRAEAMFGKALAIYPDHARSLVGLAAARSRRGDRPSADAALDHAWRAIQELKESGRMSEAAMATSFGHDDRRAAQGGRRYAAASDGGGSCRVRRVDDPVEPLLAGLRADPQFQAILERLAERAS